MGANPQGIQQGARYTHAAAVTPNDVTPLTNRAMALYVGGTGAVVVITAGGETVTFAAVPAGAILPVVVATVKATGTTATSILALY